jgi:hypothetical protein
MSSPIVIPFNFQPKAILRTSSYTIPAGEYARVTPIGVSCTVDGTEYFLGQSRNLIGTNNEYRRVGASSGDAKLTFSGGASQSKAVIIPTVVSNNAGTGQRYFNSISNTSTYFCYIAGGTVVSHNFPITDYATSLVLPNNGDATSVYYYNSSASAPIITLTEVVRYEIWVPSGTVLAGGVWHVERFNQIS